MITIAHEYLNLRAYVARNVFYCNSTRASAIFRDRYHLSALPNCINFRGILWPNLYGFSLHFKLYMQSLIQQLVGFSHFFIQCFMVLYSVCPSPFICAVVSLLPCSFYLAWKLLHLHDDDFIQYVVCPKCESLYEYHEYRLYQK